jgi:hypothetical protein
LATVCSPADTVDDQLLEAILDALTDVQPLPADAAVHLAAGYDYRPQRGEALEDVGLCTTGPR